MKASLIILISIATALSACKENYEKTFKETLAAGVSSKTTACFRLKNNHSVSFPLSVRRADGFANKGQLPQVLKAYKDAGVISVLTVEDRYGMKGIFASKWVDVIRFMSGYNSSDYWSNVNGLCIGKPELVELVRYKFVGEASSENEAIVTYTWKISDIPSWVSGASMAQFKGMSAPVTDKAYVRKYNDGWREENLPMHLLFSE